MIRKVKYCTRDDCCYLLLIDRVLPGFGQGGSQKMVLESIMLAKCCLSSGDGDRFLGYWLLI